MSYYKMRFTWSLLKEYNSVLKTVLDFILCQKLPFAKFEGCLAKKCVLHEICSNNTTRCWKLCFTSVWIIMFLFSKLEGYLAKKCVLHQMCSNNTTLCWKLCLTSFCVKNYLLTNFKHVLLRNKFCMKSAQRI